MKLYYLLAFAVVFLVGCASVIQETTDNNEQSHETDTMMDESDTMMDDTVTMIDDRDTMKDDSDSMMDESDTMMDSDPEVAVPAWQAIELKDVRTGQTFTLSDFDKPVLLESFAVWCPTCKKQQNQLKALHEDIGGDVVSIGLDTDPNEDEAKVLDFINQNDFDWSYAVAPVDLTQALIKEFGVKVVNAPSAPIVMICEDHSARFLDSGVKDVDELKSEIAKGC